MTDAPLALIHLLDSATLVEDCNVKLPQYNGHESNALLPTRAMLVLLIAHLERADAAALNSRRYGFGCRPTR